MNKMNHFSARYNGNFEIMRDGMAQRPNWVSNHGNLRSIRTLHPVDDFNADEFGENGFIILKPQNLMTSGTSTSVNFSQGSAIWNWTPGQFFAVRPHGEITFMVLGFLLLLPSLVPMKHSTHRLEAGAGKFRS